MSSYTDFVKSFRVFLHSVCFNRPRIFYIFTKIRAIVVRADVHGGKTRRTYLFDAGGSFCGKSSSQISNAYVPFSRMLHLFRGVFHGEAATNNENGAKSG